MISEVETAMVRAKAMLTGVAVFLALVVGLGSFFFSQ